MPNFHTALEASKVLDEYKIQLKGMNYNKDLRKLLQNCEKLVSNLGNAEVRARQLHKQYLTNKPREELTLAMDYLEKMLILAKLME
jgi:hypothetical protein